jgi:hypothetical protein
MSLLPGWKRVWLWLAASVICLARRWHSSGSRFHTGSAASTSVRTRCLWRAWSCVARAKRAGSKRMSTLCRDWWLWTRRLTRSHSDSLWRRTSYLQSVAIKVSLPGVHLNLGHTARLTGQDTAAAHYEQSLRLFRATQSRAAIAEVSVCIGHLARAHGDYAEAWRLYRERLPTLRAFGNRRHTADCLDGIAEMAWIYGHVVWAAQLLGTAAALRESIAIPVSPAERSGYERIVAGVRGVLGEAGFTAAARAGRALSWEQAVDQVLAMGTEAFSNRQRAHHE